MEYKKYIAPWAEPVNLVTENFTLVSGLEDYEDNPIFTDSVGTDSLGGSIL